MTKMIAVTEEIHERLFILKGMLKYKNPSMVIDYLLNSRGYDSNFFKRLEKMRKEKGLI